MNLLWLYIFVYKNNNPQANTFFLIYIYILYKLIISVDYCK